LTIGGGRRLSTGLAAALAATLLTACLGDTQSVAPAASGAADETAAATAAPTATPVPTPPPDVEIPVAVVTGYTNLKSVITAAEVTAATDAGTVVHPCEAVESQQPAPRCLPAAEIIPHLKANPLDLAFLPWGLVTPEVKVLPVDGADLFGSAEARTMAYPYSVTVPAELGWEPYDAARIRTVISPGNMCHDRGPAHAALTLGRGWDWVFGGGTAEYAGFNAPGGISTIRVVPTGNQGAMAELVSSGDVTIAEIECPFVDDFTVNEGTIFSLDPATIPLIRDTYGADVIIFAANHPFDQGVAGFIESLEHFEANGLPYAGAGRNLEEALTPATVEVNGITFGFVGHNEIPGPIPAGPDQPGVLWLTDEYHVTESVRRAREVADIVLCVPQWWGGEEYHYDWRPSQRAQQELYFEAGCDHVLGQGTHYAGPMDLDVDADGKHRLTIMSSGNFLFGQGWSQDTMEGVVFELTFRDTDLVQARMHPYVTMDQAQTNLTDPEGDGHYVLERIFEHSAADLAD
jgi:poly-gamma-glutamate capsule biosynthesis protein CapA/YwtB (metallophosphatase superfamily)